MNGYELNSIILGDSPAIQQLRRMIVKAAPATLPVLIHGPTGSGKELVAQALHRLSGRSGQFVPFNVCAIPDTMLESALFGHVRGAFTGAMRDVPGYLAEADQGTAFFDEISGLPISAQAKLLRAIELREFRPVGATRDRRSAFRVIAATNEDLDKLIDVGRFRADLLHRLRGITLSIAPLAARREDIPTLAHYFLATEKLPGATMSFTARAVSLLQEYEWPGNVRELRQVIGRVTVLADSQVVSAADVLSALEQGSRSSDRPERLEWVDDTTRRRRSLLCAVDQCGGDIEAVAVRFRVSRATIYRWLEKFNIAPPKRRRSTLPPIRKTGEESGLPSLIPLTRLANSHDPRD